MSKLLKPLNCLWLALDGQKTLDGALAKVDSVMRGPCGKYVLGVKGNDFLDNFGPTGVAKIAEMYPRLSIFLDRKFNDVADTVRNILALYRIMPLEQIHATVMVNSSIKVFRMIADDFPGLNPIIMGIPTDISEEECDVRYDCAPSEQYDDWLNGLYEAWAKMYKLDVAPAQYAVSSFDTIDMLSGYGLKPVTPGVRDKWMKGKEAMGSQERTNGVYEMMSAGAWQLVIGGQLFKGNPAEGITAEESQSRTAERLDLFFAELAAA